MASRPPADVSKRAPRVIMIPHVRPTRGGSSLAVSAGLWVIGGVVLVALILLASAIRVLREYQRAVIFRLGRLIAQKGPGLILLIPSVDRMVRVDLRTVTLDVPPQEVIPRDNV